MTNEWPAEEELTETIEVKVTSRTNKILLELQKAYGYNQRAEQF